MLRVEGLSAHAGRTALVRDVSFAMERGETLAVLGASGSGKSLTGRALIALPPRGIRYGGRVVFDGEDDDAASMLLHLDEGLPGATVRLHGIRWQNYGMPPMNGYAAPVVIRRDGIVTDCTAHANASHGLHIQYGGSNGPTWAVRAEVVNCTFSDNGLCGLGLNGRCDTNVDGDYFRFSHNLVVDNDTDPTLPDWEATSGGIKLHKFRHIDVLHNVVRGHNKGIWIDQACEDVLVFGNDVADTALWGIFYEVSSTGYIINNITRDSVVTAGIMVLIAWLSTQPGMDSYQESEARTLTPYEQKFASALLATSTTGFPDLRRISALLIS